jgi:hypothetical protein
MHGTAIPQVFNDEFFRDFLTNYLIPGDVCQVSHQCTVEEEVAAAGAAKKASTRCVFQKTGKQQGAETLAPEQSP